VIGIDPAPGTRVATGSTVTIVVSKNGEQGAEVPAVLGLSEEQATDRLQERGFEVDVVVESESDDDDAEENEGLVWKQSPGSGTKAERGSVVTIYVNPESKRKND
ncbi:MAG: PASTA domain-containing protein, partial [Actinomycetota bacterium]